MIITVAGKPCCGKSTMAEIFCKKYNFEHICAGEIFKAEAKKMNLSSAELSASDKCIEIDYKVDEYLKSVYENNKDKNILIESRTSWSFMPTAFNVFIDLDENTMAERLFNSDRTGKEKPASLEDAKQACLDRYNSDVNRYKKIYNIDCDNFNNYTLVFNNAKMTPEETADYIFKRYSKFNKKCSKIAKK